MNCAAHYITDTLYAGGADGGLRIWDLGNKLASAPRERVKQRQVLEPLAIPVQWIPKVGGPASQSIRAFDITPDGSRLVVGTAACTVWLCELDIRQKLQVRSVDIPDAVLSSNPALVHPTLEPGVR